MSQRERGKQAAEVFEQAFRASSALGRFPAPGTPADPDTGPRKPAPVPEVGRATTNPEGAKADAEYNFAIELENSYRRAGGR